MNTFRFITNMEAHFVGMQAATSELHALGCDVRCAIDQIDDQESWTRAWEQALADSAFTLITWMGTGLCCDFLKKSSAFMQAHKKRHFYGIIDPGDAPLSCGIGAEETRRIQDYLACGGLQNYRNLCLWIANAFCGAACRFEPSRQLPWAGIYHPDLPDAFLLDTPTYLRLHCQPNRPVIGLLFSREDWLWEKLEYQKAIVEELKRQNCNSLAVFVNTMGDSARGIPSLAEHLQRFFYCGGKPCIDALVNPFVFSLTLPGFVKLEDIRKLQVPVLQIHNLYESFEWWQKSAVGMSANEVSYAVAMPEFDGVIHAVLTSTSETLNDGTHRRRILPERIRMLARKAKKWAALRRKANRDKRVAIVFHNYPPTNSNIGSASCLDSIESVRLLLEALAKRGYTVDEIPADSQSLIEAITAHATNDRRFLSEALIEAADGKLSSAAYGQFFAALPLKNRQELTRDWKEAPGDVFRYGDDLLVPGMSNGNLYITVQPPRGFGDDPAKIYHAPDCTPTHHYLGFYHWLRDVWKADAVIHMGTHGNLEWLPGKGNAMSDACYPDIATGDLPNIYPYWITCVGEGIQAKRRSAACLISYLSAPMSISGTYEELAELEQLLEEYCHFKSDESAKAEQNAIAALIRNKAAECNLEEDVPENPTMDFAAYAGALHNYITDIKNMQMRIGLHVLGVPPQGDELLEYLLALTKLENGSIPSLTKTLAKMYGYEYYTLLENSAVLLPDRSKTYGMLLDEIRQRCAEVLHFLAVRAFDPDSAARVFELPWTDALQGALRGDFERVVRYICAEIAPSLLQTTFERENTLRALEGCYVDPCPSGAPTSGGADLLPTGRNFYSADPRTLPTKAAWEIGKQMAENVIEKFIASEGRYPESVGIILWATSNLRNHGQCIAEFLCLMGLRPVWQKAGGRVVGLEVIPLAELKRPRVDVTGRISGLFRDSMPASVSWLNEAVGMVSNLDEDLSQNFVRKHILEETQELEAQGLAAPDAWRQASFRIFGDPPGAHGAGIGAVLDAKNWKSVDDLADVYTRWGAHAYGASSEGAYLPERFQKRMSQIDVTVQNVDHCEASMLSGDDYNSYRGGMVAAVRSAKGAMPQNYVNDSSDSSKLQIRTLTEELKRWFRGEAVNPKYIAGMKKHGYKGAGDLATYVATSYQWDATSAVMEDWMYEKYAEKYALDAALQQWMREVNPWALHRIAEVLLEAQQRGLWNAREETKQELQQLYLSLEGELEERGDAQ